MKIKRIGLLVIGMFMVAACLVSTAHAQSFVGGGVVFTRTTATDENNNVVGGYIEAGAPLPLNLEMRFLGEYLFRPTLPTIFTRDANPQRQAYREAHVVPSLRFNLTSKETEFFRPFVFGGIDYFRQQFKGEEKSKYGRTTPTSGLNPMLGFGVGVGNSVEVSYAHLFTDNTILNNSQLRGDRVGADYQKQVSERLAFKIGGQIDYLTYRETSGFKRYEADEYVEYDVRGRIRVGLVLK